MKTKSFLFVFSLVYAFTLFARSLSEISVDLKMDERDYVSGERIRAVVDVKNLSPDKLSVGYKNSRDHLVIEVFRASDKEMLERKGKPRAFVAAFTLKSNEGQKLETFIGDHYPLEEPRGYLARAVLVHDSFRYEGPYRAFSIVNGMKITSAKQMFKGIEHKSRRFDLLRWPRNNVEHIFLSAVDEHADGTTRSLGTTDIGAMLRITKPTISILPHGEVIVLHRNGADSFVRSEFWSLPDVLHLNNRISVADPATAAQTRIQELYKKEGGVKPVSKPWYKFW